MPSGHLAISTTLTDVTLVTKQKAIGRFGGEATLARIPKRFLLHCREQGFLYPDIVRETATHFWIDAEDSALHDFYSRARDCADLAEPGFGKENGLAISASHTAESLLVAINKVASLRRALDFNAVADEDEDEEVIDDLDDEDEDDEPYEPPKLLFRCPECGAIRPVLLDADEFPHEGADEDELEAWLEDASAGLVTPPSYKCGDCGERCSDASAFTLVYEGDQIGDWIDLD